MNAEKGTSLWAAPSVLPQKWLTRVFLLRLGQGFAIIMPTEETALRFLRTAVAAFSPLEEAVLRRETHSRPGGRFCPERSTQCPRNPSPK